MIKGYNDLLRNVVKGWDTLSDRERAIAFDVVDWYEGDGATETDRYENKVVGSIWTAARMELGERSIFLATKKRDRDLNDVRYVMYRLVCELLPDVPKSHITVVLGIGRHHASILNALSRADELIEADVAFRNLYNRLARRTRACLEGE